VQNQFQKARLKFQPHAGILLYHRVADLPSDPQLLSVTPAHFEEQIRYIAHNYYPVSLGELLDIKQKKKIPKNTIAITFDDGYADNLWNALPILKKYRVPATVFVTTGYLDTDREFWWDDLERMILLPDELPGTLTLMIDEGTYTWEGLEGHRGKKPGNAHDEGAREVHPRYERWDVTQGFFPGPRYRLYSDLHRLLRPLQTVERQSVLQRLASWSGVSGIGRPDYRALSRDELYTLGQDELVEIGSHSVTHPVLKYESQEDQKKEISKSKQDLEEILHHRVTSFSYPFGTKGDFSRETENLVKIAGYTIACTNYEGTITRWTDQYRFARYLVRDWTRDEFAHNVSEWSNG
jgi:peptidoglycan/xylan/chitin deacetylase (PgdA/CDA1 family)